MHRARVSLLFHAAVALLLTWPLAAHLGDSIPQGIEPATTVPLFNLWTLRWNQQQAGDLYRHYWDAPIFHPVSGSFALSEPQPLTGLFFTPISWITHNPTLAYNVTLLAILALNGFAAARLCRRLGAWPGPAALAGLLAQALPFVATQLGVLQLTVLFPIFLTVDALLAWAPRGGRKQAIGIGLWLAATFLTCGYYGLFSVVVVGLTGLTLVRRSWLTWSRVIDAAAAVAAFVGLALPVLLTQARYTSSYSRSDELILDLSADPVDWLRLHPDQHGASVMPWLQDTGGTSHYLYPGTVLLVLAVVGFTLGFLRSARSTPQDDDALPADEPRTDARTDERRRIVFVLDAACLALVLSLGLRLNVGGFRPYDLLRSHVPGFANLRSPFRFAVLTQIFLVPLAALALDALWAWRPRRDAESRAVGSRAIGAVLAALIVVVGVIEVTPVPQRLFVVRDPGGDWVSWLHDQPRTNEPGDGSVAMVPFPATGAATSYQATTEAMLSGLEHGRPLVNGYSGLFPPSYDALEADMMSFPSERSVRHLRAVPVSYVVVDRSWLTPEAEGWMHDWSAELTRVFDGRDKVIYRLNP